MSILANLGFVVPDDVGGTEQYSVRLLEALLVTGGDPDQRVPEIDDRLIVAGHRSLFAAHPALARLDHAAFRGPVGMRPYRLAVESTWLAGKSTGAELVHHFGGRMPAVSGGGRMPAVSHGRAVLTVHDLQHLDLPDYVHPVKQRYLRWAIPRSLHKADLVCTPSAWVKGRLTEHYGLPDERIRVVSSTASGCADVGARASSGSPAAESVPGAWPRAEPPHLDEAAAARVAAEIGQRPMVLYPALSHPHKNHKTLIAAFARLQQDRPDLMLVLTGAPGRSAAELAGRIRAVDPAGRFICHLGRVPAPLLAELTARADVLAFPSRYEGFGLPVLEAMHAGTPVVASDATAIPEVVGDAAVLVDPDDADAWAASIGDVLDNENRRRELIAAGLARAGAYSARAAAAALRDAWRDALA